MSGSSSPLLAGQKKLSTAILGGEEPVPFVLLGLGRTCPHGLAGTKGQALGVAWYRRRKGRRNGGLRYGRRPINPWSCILLPIHSPHAWRQVVVGFSPDWRRVGWWA